MLCECDEQNESSDGWKVGGLLMGKFEGRWSDGSKRDAGFIDKFNCNLKRMNRDELVFAANGCDEIK